eukprot:2309277-Heterocapsa_arctica.AAC.1
MEQTKNNTDTNQWGYIVSEDLRNKEYAGKLDEKAKLAESRCPNLNIKGDIVEEIMAMGFSWQNAGTKFTDKFRKERANISIGSHSKA